MVALLHTRILQPVSGSRTALLQPRAIECMYRGRALRWCLTVALSLVGRAVSKPATGERIPERPEGAIKVTCTLASSEDEMLQQQLLTSQISKRAFMRCTAG